MKKQAYLSLLFVLVMIIGCMPHHEEKITDIKFDLSNTDLQKVLTFKDQQLTDSLIPYFKHKDPTYRYAAAMAFASVQDEEALSGLSALLLDDVEAVRVAAAYAIGQLGLEQAENILVGSFRTNDSTSADALFNKTVLEAVGKCGSAGFLKAMSTVSTYKKTDTLLLEGQAWGIYRYALRNITTEEGTDRMVELITRSGYPNTVRFIAANYLSRARDIKIDTFAIPLIQTFNQEKDSRIKMALAIALGKTKKSQSMETLKNAFATASDYRVQCNILRALSNFEYENIKDIILPTLKADNIHVANVAAQVLVNKGIGAEGVLYMRTARDTTLHWTTQSLIYTAANKHTPAYFEATIGSINADLRRLALSAQDPYKKGAMIKALSQYPWNYKYVYDLREKYDSPVVKTAIAEGLASIAERPDFDSFFGLGRRKVKRDLSGFFLNIINDGNVGPVAVVSNTISNPDLNYKEFIESDTTLQKALAKLDLPKEIETYNELKKAIDYINSVPASAPKELVFSHPIDWRVVNTVSETSRATIKTVKGDIILDLFYKEAPGTVANFINLCRSGFYDNKNFHRVVPNFVIQGGCPRGDGYGSLDYTIRSEFAPFNYDHEGYVGMASAGKDTEGTQFFITHSPTPHLDGKYTVFAKVVEGQDVIHDILPGDVIDRIIIE